MDEYSDVNMEWTFLKIAFKFREKGREIMKSTKRK